METIYCSGFCVRSSLALDGCNTTLGRLDPHHPNDIPGHQYVLTDAALAQFQDKFGEGQWPCGGSCIPLSSSCEGQCWQHPARDRRSFLRVWNIRNRTRVVQRECFRSW